MLTGRDLLNSHLGFRTSNHWVEASRFVIRPGDANHTGWDRMQNLKDVLDNPNYMGIKYRYFNTPGYEVYMEKFLRLPFRLLLNYCNTLMRPLYTDFTEVTENEDFAAVSAKFYAQLFIQEYIFVTYDVFGGKTEFTLKDPVDSRNKQVMEAIKAKGGFDIWVKLNENEYSDSIEFMHLDTSLTVKFPKWREQLAWCRWGAIYQDNLINWMNIAGTELLMYQYVDQCVRMTGKKLTFTTMGNSDEQKEKLDEMLNNFDNYIHFNLKNTANLEQLESLTGEDLLAIKDVAFYYMDRLKFEYGRVANTNPKGERITSGENYKDISAIANRQKETLEYLIYFAMQVKRIWGIELEFAISGIPEKEAVYSVAHGAQTPNMEKEMFGQIEGTNPRPPIGQKGIRKTNKAGSWSH